MTITDEHTQTQEPTRTAGSFGRVETYWQAHPRVSAVTAFGLTVIYALIIIPAYCSHDLLVVGLSYVAMVVSGIWGALEWHRVSVSAGHGRAM